MAISSSDIKRQIREAAEEEERVNYLENRMNDEWQEALAPLGTDHHKEFLEIAPWIVVLFEQRYEQQADGQRRKNLLRQRVLRNCRRLIRCCAPQHGACHAHAYAIADGVPDEAAWAPRERATVCDVSYRASITRHTRS